MKTQKSIYLLPTGVLLFVSLLLSVNPAHATMIHFQTALTGPGESPANVSPGMGTADVYFDDWAQTMEVKVSFWDLLGTATASHIHAATAMADTGTAGVATETPTFGGFPLGVQSGTYDHMFDLTLAASFNGAFITANGGTVANASAALENALLSDKAYLNIHTTMFPSGEIRGFLHTVPDSASTALLLTVALSGMAGLSRTQKMRA
jgi:hypothetical protein